MDTGKTRHIRTSPEFRKLIMFIQGMCLAQGKHPPCAAKIQTVIVDKIDREELLNDILIRL